MKNFDFNSANKGLLSLRYGYGIHIVKPLRYLCATLALLLLCVGQVSALTEMTNTNIKNVLDNDYVMVYLGVGSSWGSSSTVAALNNGNTTTAKVYTTTSRGSSSAEPYYFWHEITTAIPKGSSGTYYLTNNKGNWAGQSITAALKAGGAYWMNGDWSGYTTKYSSNIFHTTSPTASIPTTARSVTQGSTISVTTTLTKGYKNLPYSAVYSKMNLKFYAKDSSDKFWEVGTNTSLTTATSVSTTLSGVAELSAGTYTIYAALYDSYGVYIKATNTFTLTVTTPSVPTVSFGTTSSTINWGDKVNITVTTANIADGSTITFKAGGSSIGTASVSSNSATLSNYQPTAFAASTTITAEYSSTTSTNSYTLSMRTPAVSLSASPTTAGTGDNVTFTATKSNVSSNATVTYKFEDTTSGTTTIQAASNTATCTTSWASSGSKTVKVTMTVTFSGSSKTATATKSITISPKTTIYFDNSITNWSNVYLYLYSKDYDYNTSNGAGSKTDNGAYSSSAYTMTKITGTNYYSYTYLGNVPAYVAFTKYTQNDYGNFWWQTENSVYQEVVYRAFDSSKPLIIVNSNTTTIKNSGAKYYTDLDISVYPPATYTLTVTSANISQGTITTPSSGSYTDVAKNASKSIVASPKSGYRFKNWTASPAANATITSSTSASTTVTVKGDVTVTANFEKTYTLTVTSQTGGTITAPSGGTATVGNSQTTTITVSKSNGYTFTGWEKVSGTATITNASNLSTTVTGVSANTTVRANFTQDEYTVTVNSVGGTISAPASGTYTGKHYGDNVTITTVNTNAYTFLGWEASPAANATITNASLLSTTATIKGNVTLTARYRTPITVYFSNEQCWDAVALYAWDTNDDTKLPSGMNSWPGIEISQDEDGWWYYTFDKAITTTKLIFNNNNGGKQTNNIENVTATSYYAISSTDGERTYTTVTDSYVPAACTPDVYTVVGDASWLGVAWDTDEPTNEMRWNSTYNRYEIRKIGVSLTNGTTYSCKFIKNHDYSGPGHGSWPSSNYTYTCTSTGSKDILFWVKPSSDFLHPGLDDSYGVEVYSAADYYINHTWGDGDGSWSKKQMTYTGIGSTYTVSGIFGGTNGADVYDGSTKKKYYSPAEITGFSDVMAGDNVIFTYDATNSTLSVSCPSCARRYWICVPTTTGSTLAENPYPMTYNSEDGLYYTDPDTQPFLWPNNGAKVNSANNCTDNWIDRNNIVNYSNMTLAQPVFYVYDAELNILTVEDANTPRITLSASQVINGSYDLSTITLTTTSSKTIAGATYKYQKLSGPDGTLAASATNTTTFTTSNEGTYRFQVTVTGSDGKSFTATCTVKVKFKITVYANVSAPNWTGVINLYYWADGVAGANHEMTSVGGKWYKYVVNGVPEFSFLVRNNTGTGNAQTVDIGPIDDDICIIVNSGLQDGKRTYSTTNDCELYMRFASTYRQYKGDQDTEEDVTVYSNYFKQDGDEVSFYIGSTPNVKYQTFNSTNNAWNTGTTVSTGVTSGNVYAGKYSASAANKLSGLKAYTGDFYIRTDGAPGGWSNYMAADQTMFEFSRNDYYQNEWYNHYWCKWIEGNPNVKAVVANEINPAITDTLPDFVLTQGTNMRFEYDNQTNYIGRQFLKGSGSDFLRIFASDTDAENFIYKTDATDTRIKKANAVTFLDKSDWVYQIDVLAKPSGSDVNVYVLGRYPVTRAGIGAASDQDNYLGGYEADGTTPTPIKIMGSTTTAGTYNMRLIYDYKTNRLMAAWYPQGDEVGGTETTVDANLMISRTDDSDAVTFSMANSNAKVVSINQMISALIITRSEYNTRKAAGNYYYWVSLPYNCLVRDIYGINGYGKKWVVQRYRGDKRAQYGFRDDITTFWANMKQNATATMEANRGYVIRLQLTDADFKEINGTSQVTLYFPSCNTEDIQLKNNASNLETTVPSYVCNVIEPATGNSRKNWDSHWNVIGQPGLKTMAMTNPLSLPAGHEDEYKNHPKYYYKWSWSDGHGVYTPTAVSGADNAFKTMFSYMVQYGGSTLVWSPNIETIDPSLAPRRMRQKEDEDVVIGLSISAEREVEHIEGEDLHSRFETVTDQSKTIVTLSEDGSEQFSLNRDMACISEGGLKIYTVYDNTNTAGKVLPLETNEVSLSVDVAQANEYTFSLDREVEERTLTLLDSELGTETVLNKSDYTVELQRGKYAGRFILKITDREEVETDLAGNATEGSNDWRIFTDGNTLYVEGLAEPSEMSMYDVTGRELCRGLIVSGQRLIAPQTGVYLIQIGQDVRRIVLR